MTQKETAQERLARMKREKDAAKAAATESGIVGQLNHETSGEPDYEAIAKRLQERKARESQSENAGHVKMTVYVEQNVADAFNALCVKRGDQKALLNEALKDLIKKKTRELGMDQ